MPAYRALLLDLSGTLHIGSRPTPRGIESLAKLRAAGVPFRICSNTSKDSARALAQKLRDMGYDIREHEMFTSLQACKAELVARRLARSGARHRPTSSKSLTGAWLQTAPVAVRLGAGGFPRLR